MNQIYQGKIHIDQLIEGARRARGLTVIIDVFRAFSVECYLVSMGVKSIRPVGAIEDALQLAEKIPDPVLFGERAGRRVEGFDFGNSPAQIIPASVKGKNIIHTTSAGTQGIINAKDADEILMGSLVGARAIADYILKKNPPEVSLIAMGDAGISPTEEDELCARYIRSLLLGEKLDMKTAIAHLEGHGGKKFFNPEMQDVFPEEDYWMCTKVDLFDYVLRAEKDELGYIVKVLTASE